MVVFHRLRRSEQGNLVVFHVTQYLIHCFSVTIEFGKVPFLDLRSCCSFNKEYHLKKSP